MNEDRKCEWTHFQIRNVGVAMQRLMTKKFSGDAKKLRAHALDSMANVLGIDFPSFSDTQRKIFADFAGVLLLVPEFKRWSDDDKKLLKRIIEAKAYDDEGRYLKLMQRHERLRSEIIRLGRG